MAMSSQSSSRQRNERWKKIPQNPSLIEIEFPQSLRDSYPKAGAVSRRLTNSPYTASLDLSSTFCNCVRITQMVWPLSSFLERPMRAREK